MLERLVLFFINLFCPPITVLILTGPSTDALINTLLFIAGVIPGHIHGFFISCVYFHRKGKVRKGRWPGGRVKGVYSRAVWNGGVSDERVDELWVRKEEREMREMGRGGRRGEGSKRGGGGVGGEMSGRGNGGVGRDMSGRGNGGVGGEMSGRGNGGVGREMSGRGGGRESRGWRGDKVGDMV